ncbi:MAG: type II toxin-antitoxin system RelE/ParE family toxin [Verrucomicrobiota bacterium]
MSWRVILRPKAETDLSEAARWYEAQRQNLGDRFLDEIGRVLDLLESSPERRPVYYRGFRPVLTRRFPYKLFYRIEGDKVIIVRVLHAKRDHRLHL